MSAPDRFQAVRELLASSVGPVFPAAQLLVVDRGDTVLDEAVGDCTRATVFDLASLTKALATTTLAMRLVERGRLSLDDTVLPGVPLRLLLCHASGLPAWRPFYQLLAPRRGEPGFDPRRALVEAARAEPLERPPGTRSVYSDLGFLLLGDAIERAGGARLDEQFASLAREVGLAGLAGFAGFDGRAALTYGADPAACAPTEILDGVALRGVVHDDNCRFAGGVCGHAGLFGTASAVSRAVTLLVDAWHGQEGGLVAPDTVRRFWLPCGVPGSDWCLGWDRPATLTSSSTVSSAGTRWPRDGVGHLGFTGCSLWIHPARRRWVILLSNRVHPRRDNEAIKALRPRLHDAIVAALDD